MVLRRAYVSTTFLRRGHCLMTAARTPAVTTVIRKCAPSSKAYTVWQARASATRSAARGAWPRAFTRSATISVKPHQPQRARWPRWQTRLPDRHAGKHRARRRDPPSLKSGCRQRPDPDPGATKNFRAMDGQVRAVISARALVASLIARGIFVRNAVLAATKNRCIPRVLRCRQRI